ncbi:hypothetical protein PMIN01_13575 [Paraphaeosphaeria minitans]|uniref:Uncharacterized protein n=1 Tax=Paraphaeosphaeria minitans TaxID=565426 RepID=A0A9P6G435_9PLEO|nr:hypothetical protein PMIN01_13575 [Paraphaeosphaeria minitans]
MFGTQFKEGDQLLHGECRVIERKEDDASTMNVVLRILHFRGSIEDMI